MPPIIEDFVPAGYSSPGEFSSPETPTEQELKYEQKENKKQKRKKSSRRPRMIMSPPADAQLQVFYEDDIGHRDGGYSSSKKSNNYEDAYRNGGLPVPKVEKSSSFKRKTKPPNLESLMAREYSSGDGVKSPTSRPDSRSSNNNNNNNGKRDIEFNIVLLGDFGVGKTGQFNKRCSDVV